MMNWEAIGAVGEVGGAVVVVATLVYLARQIRHNAESTLASIQFAIGAEFNRMHEGVITSRDVLEMLEKVSNSEDLDPIETRRFNHYANRLLNQWVSIQKAYDHGAVDLEFFEMAKEDVVRACDLYPGLKAELREMLGAYSARREILEALYK